MSLNITEFNRFVRKTDTCWFWMGNKDKNGYGIFSGTARHILPSRFVHRYSYELFKTKIPEDLEIDHLCRNRACANPDHLEAVTSKVNTLRSPIALAACNARKTHCKRGHEFTPENTRNKSTKQGIQRVCKQCLFINIFHSTRLKRIRNLARKALKTYRSSAHQ